jgi:hypothetical protein
MDSPPAVFRTRVDRWLVVVLGIALLIALGSAVAVFAAAPVVGLLTLAGTAGTVGLVAALSLPTEYVVTERALIVRFGLFRTEIPFAAIERVYPTRNPLSAPAWSLDRLGIDYRTERRRGRALISPVRPEAFLSLLAARAGLDRQGSELRRTGPSLSARA